MEIAFSFSLLIRNTYNIDLMLPKLICHNIKLSLARHANDVYRSNQLTYSTGKTIFLTSKIDTNLIILEYKFTIITPYGLQISFSLKLNNLYFEYNKIERTKFYSCWKQNWHMLYFSLIRKKQRKFEKVLTWKLGILEKWIASKSYTLIVLFCLTDWYGYVWWGEEKFTLFHLEHNNILDLS